MSTLVGTAMDWFISLPDGHVTSFSQLSQLFREQYQGETLKEYQGETLKEFVNRFGTHVVKVNTKDKTMMVHAFRKGICPGPLSESLIRSRPKTFAEITRRVVPHIAAEGEVNEKRAHVVPTRPRAPARAQPMRVHEAVTGKKS